MFNKFLAYIGIEPPQESASIAATSGLNGRVTLADAPDGTEATILSLAGEGPIIRRLAELGFTSGTRVKILRRAPFSDPIEFEIRGYLISLRRQEAEMVVVQLEPAL